MVKSDNSQEIGMHVFQRAGLGLAPFKFVDFYTARYQACPGAPVQPGAGCEFCGTGIMQVCVIESADKKRFKVGVDCLRKTGEAGLIKSYKTHPEIRKMNRARALAADNRVIEEWKQITADEKMVAALSAPKITGSKTGESWLSYALRAWGWCGAAGRKRYLKSAKQILQGTHPIFSTKRSGQ